MRPYVHEIVDLPDRPWRVACVCDPDGPDAAFAVTVGLAALGLPELLLPARPVPPAGPDPQPRVGPHWRLSHRDLTEILGDLAEELLAGGLWSGTLHATLDAGVTAARLRPAAPVPVEALDEALPTGLTAPVRTAASVVVRTLGAGPAGRFGDDPAGTTVVAVPWELVDGAAGMAVFLASISGQDPAPLADQVAAVRARSEALRSQILGRGARPGHVPSRWRPAPGRLPGRPATGRTGLRFGPRHELVVARAEQLLLSDPALLTAFLQLAGQLDADTTGQVLGPLETLAATSGRPQVPAELELAADDVTTLLTGQGGHRLRWRLAWQALPASRPHRERQQAVEETALQLLRTNVHALLAAEAFSDVLPIAALLCGRLAWVAALDASGLPGRQARHR